MKIPIVNEQDEIIGEEERLVIHQKGLLHREAHVIFITLENKIIFQKRGLHKETYPGLLDLTVGGHVDSINDSYESTAEREALEETGVDVRGKLVFIEKNKSKSFDNFTNLINYKFTTIFGYTYSGGIKDLRLEDGEALGFEVYSIRELEGLDEEGKNKFIPKIISSEYISIYKNTIFKLHETQS